LIVLDIDQSNLSGEETIAYLRSNLTAYASGIPILLMASKVDSQMMARYHSLGVARSIRKPYSATKLLNVMAEIFQLDEAADD
ncbi:MAG: hypothetical protein KAH12_00070, partial [Anaerolineales bacterium]|nr:hypothetical protein [Anaerolineales bacterium]